MSLPRAEAGSVAQLGDAEVIERVLAGDADLYRVLVRRYQESLFRIAYSLVLDSDVASDLVQDAFTRAFVNLARCRDRGRFRVWLVATLRNRAFDHLKEKRRGDVSLADDDVLRRAEAFATEGPDAGERYALRASLEDALARLTTPLREAFVLRHVEQLSTEEVAEVLGTSVSAIKMRVQRARAQLQEWLSPHLR